MWKVAPLETATTQASRTSAASAEATARAALTLYVSPSFLDFQWKKIAITANLVGVALHTIKISEEELASLLPHARSCVLQTKHGLITQTVTVCRYLASLRPDLGLAGNNDWEEAQVDQWMEFAWLEMEVLVAALELPMDEASAQGQVSEAAVKEAVREDTAKSLAALRSRLENCTWVAGERLTLADVHLAVLLGRLLSLGVVDPVSLGEDDQLASLRRWFLSCAHHPTVRAVLGDPPALGPHVPRKGALTPSSSSSSSSSSPSATPGGGAKPAKSKASPAASTSAGAAATSTSAAGAPVVPPLQPRFSRKRTRVAELLDAGLSLVGREVTVKGWARTMREADKGELLFVALTDGSCAAEVQVVMSRASTRGFEEAQPSACGGTDASLAVVGTVVESPGSGQAVEVKADRVEVLGKVFAGEHEGEVSGKYYPLARNRKGHSLEYLRTKAHLRPRARSYAAVQRVRNAMAYATHDFFFRQGFLYVHTPLITGADCEGAGEMFSVTTLLPKDPAADLPRTKDGRIDFSSDFFGQQAGLTVSGQLNVETHCCALSDVYTFGPTFRAENSHTSRHLAEFWMIEPEIAFAGLQEDMDLAEDYLKHCVHFALTHCAEDLAFLEKVPGWDADLRARLANVLERPFTRLTYTEAVRILEEEVAAGRVSFEVPVSWGIDLASEHERFLAETMFKGPIIVTNYPKEIKAFYMKLDTDGRTVQAMDILVPRIGEIIGGSVREDRFDVLKQRAAAVRDA